VATYVSIPSGGPTVTVRWNPSERAVGYKVWATTNLAEPFRVIGVTGGTQMVFAMTSPQCFYRVTATNEYGESN
jgi:hypothetical protein